jgi:hypothetical protein
MEFEIFDYLTSRQLSTGRRLFAVKAVRAPAEGYGDAFIVKKCDASLAFDEETLRLEMAYRTGRSLDSTARGRAAEVDAEIDELLGGIYSIAEGQAVGEDATAKKAASFLPAVFPEGLGALTGTTFEEQLAQIEALLKRFDGDLAATVDALGMRRHADGLAVLAPQFRVELEKEVDADVSYADVKKARIEGLNKFAAVVFAVLATYDGDSAEHRARRDELLSEYHRQNALITEAYRRNRRLGDVDPDTGEPIEDEASDRETVEPVV